MRPWAAMYSVGRTDVRVVDLRREANLRWLEGIVCGERDREEENAARIW